MIIVLRGIKILDVSSVIIIILFYLYVESSK